MYSIVQYMHTGTQHNVIRNVQIGAFAYTPTHFLPSSLSSIYNIPLTCTLKYT